MRSIIITLSIMLLLGQTGSPQENPQPVATFLGGTPFDLFGQSIAVDGDLNGDHVNDLVITRFSLSAGGFPPDTGKAVIYFGNSFQGEIPVNARDVEIIGEQPQDFFGYPFVSMDDISGDGIDDLLVSAPLYEEKGRAYIFFGGSWPSTLTADRADVIITNTSQFTEAFGVSGTLIGDYNGDHISDLVISANYGNDVGQIFLFWGPLQAGILPSDGADINIIGENVDDLFGLPVTGKGIAAGDVNNDGRDDLIVGAYGYDGTGSNIGRVYVFHGDQLTSGATIQDANVVITGTDTGLLNDIGFGSSIVTGDVDADGKADILIGEFGDNPAIIGTYYLFLGESLTASMQAGDANWTVTGTQSQQFDRERWSALADLGGDGRADIIIGSPRTNAVYIFTDPLLGQNQLTPDADLIITGDSQRRIGNPFTGDIVGGSRSDLLVAGTLRLSSTDSIGVVYVYDDIAVTGILDEAIRIIPSSVRLFQNYPNPFNASTRISYSIPNSGYVTLKVYDMLGKEIQTLVSKVQKAGDYFFNFDASTISSGIYFYKLQASSDFVETRKMLLIR